MKLVKTKYHFNQNSLLTIISQIKRLETLPCRKVGGGGYQMGKVPIFFQMENMMADSGRHFTQMYCVKHVQHFTETY